MPTIEQAGAVLEIDLDAVVGNYRAMAEKAPQASCAAVLKADGYGLGSIEVTRALAAAGCKEFFVAHVSEGILLRNAFADITIYVLHGPPLGAEKDCLAHGLIPVLNDPGQIERWRSLARAENGLAAILHVDTGMSRLGLTQSEVSDLENDPDRLAGIDTVYVISHLVSAEEPEHPLNEKQRHRFDDLRQHLPVAKAGLANSSGIFLGPAFHYDLIRPGVALYGVNPTPNRANPMTPVVRLAGKIIQIREIAAGQSVGYGATYKADDRRRIATIPVGYADGYPRALGNRAEVSVAGVKVPVVGRVSMDLITIDVTDVPEKDVHVGALVDLIGGGIDIDTLAAQADTIAYDVLTSLAGRFHRIYRGGGV
jgi:alanine racemase